MTPHAPPVLPDLLMPGLLVVFCGTAAGTQSARRGHYYAGPGNKFWRMLHETGLTPRRLVPRKASELPALGIGLTDLAKHTSGPDASLRPEHLDLAAAVARLRVARPRILAFNGVKAARLWLGQPTGPVRLGAMPDPHRVADQLVALPSTSGAAGGTWDEKPWHQLGRTVRAIRAGVSP